MEIFIVKTLLASSIIAFCSWLSEKQPDLAGFIVALPLSTLMVLAFSYLQYGDAQAGTRMAKSVFVATPLTLFFFIPFLFAEKWKLSFWTNYFMAIGFLSVSYLLHRLIMAKI